MPRKLRPEDIQMDPEPLKFGRHRGLSALYESVWRFGPMSPIETDLAGRIIHGNSRWQVYSDLRPRDEDPQWSLRVIDKRPGEIIVIRHAGMDLSIDGGEARAYRMASQRSESLSWLRMDGLPAWDIRSLIREAERGGDVDSHFFQGELLEEFEKTAKFERWPTLADSGLLGMSVEEIFALARSGSR